MVPWQHEQLEAAPNRHLLKFPGGGPLPGGDLLRCIGRRPLSQKSGGSKQKPGRSNALQSATCSRWRVCRENLECALTSLKDMESDLRSPSFGVRLGILRRHRPDLLAQEFDDGFGAGTDLELFVDVMA